MRIVSLSSAATRTHVFLWLKNPTARASCAQWSAGPAQWAAARRNANAGKVNARLKVFLNNSPVFALY